MLHFVGDGDQKKFTKNPRHFSMPNSQANSKKKSTKCFWRAVKVRKCGVPKCGTLTVLETVPPMIIKNMSYLKIESVKSLRIVCGVVRQHTLLRRVLRRGLRFSERLCRRTAKRFVEGGCLVSRSPKANHNSAGRSDIRNQRFEPGTAQMLKVPLIPIPEKQGSEETPQSENAANAENADAKTRKMRKMRLTGFNGTGFG